MSIAIPISTAPGSVGTAQAIAFAVSEGAGLVVSAAQPLPVAATPIAASSAPLAGTVSASGAIGPFVPQLGRAIWLTLSGSWSGTAQLLRSTDGGTTKLPLTVAGSAWASFTANANEAVVEESDAAASYWLAVTLVSGSLTYRVAQ